MVAHITMTSPSKPANAPGAAQTVPRSRLSAGPPQDATYVLSVVEGPDAGRSFTLDSSSPSRVFLGTSPVCGLRLSDPEVSRRHASLTLTGENLHFADLDSTNGTTVNGVHIKEVRLVGGEAVRVGRSVLTLQRGQPKPSDVGDATSFGRILGESVAMRRLYPILQTLAAGNGMLLIEGESGTGKELLAEEIHRASRRSQSPFIVLDAHATPSEQISVRLFGSADGPGLLEMALGGVLFIDEIGDLSRAVQKRLRGILRSTDVRLIASTARDLDRDVTEGRFDEEFFFELATGRIELPPLRQREGDVTMLARRFWEEFATGAGEAPPPFPVDLLPRFEHYPWPGNVRELRSVVIQRATFGELSPTHLSDHAAASGLDIMAAVIHEGLPFPPARDRVVREFERRYLEAALARHGGNVSAAARASGIAQRYFQIVRARYR
jgi:DNA-binding NtrC family response regulator